MKKFFFSLLIFLPFTFWGCTYGERCDVTNQADLEYLWCPKLDTAIVDWMPKLELLTPYYKNWADCERFENIYVPQHEQIHLCENNSVVGKMSLNLGALMGSYKNDSNVVTLQIYAGVIHDNGAESNFYDDIAKVFFDIYGCTEYGCQNAKKVHVYIKEGLSFYFHWFYDQPEEEDRITFDKWFPPDSFKIVETNSKPPSASDGYYRYLHFRLNVDAPSIKTTIKVWCDSNCYNTWNTPNTCFPIGG